MEGIDFEENKKLFYRKKTQQNFLARCKILFFN